MTGWSFGFEARGGGGRFMLLLFAAASAICMIGIEGRSNAAFGMTTTPGWERSFLGAFLFGVALSAGLFGFAGAVSGLWTGDTPGTATIAHALAAGLAALPMALLQEIVYRGYINGKLADRFGWPLAIPAGAAVFALTAGFDHTIRPLSDDAAPAALGAFLYGMLLGLTRLYHGSLVVPIALVAGLGFTEFFMFQTRAFHGDANEWLAAWFEPRHGQLVRSRAMWVFAGGAILAYFAAFAVKRGRKSGMPETSGRASWPMKILARAIPVYSPWMLAPLDLWIRELRRARFKIDLQYIPRIAAILPISTVMTLLNAPERWLSPFLFRNRKFTDPVVIVGAHRSGTTHLQRLLALDPRFCAPRTQHVLNPHGFRLAGRAITFLLAPFLPWRRPMDAMEYSLLQPDEDEFAIALSSGLSPYWSFVFPRNADHYDKFICAERMTQGERRAWRHTISCFLAKLPARPGQRILLKSPFHAGRVELIVREFPNAQFIHIHRNPLHVYLSNIRFQKQTLPLFVLQTPLPGQAHAERYLEQHYLALVDAYYDATRKLPADRTAEVSYEDLVESPEATIESAYRQLGLEPTPGYRARLAEYLRENEAYRSHDYRDAGPEVRARAARHLRPLFELWGYDPGPSQPRRR